MKSEIFRIEQEAASRKFLRKLGNSLPLSWQSGIYKAEINPVDKAEMKKAGATGTKKHKLQDAYQEFEICFRHVTFSF